MNSPSNAESRWSQWRAALGGRRQLVMCLLTMPLVIFVVVVFLFPVARFLALSVDNSDKAQALGRTAAVLIASGTITPDEAAYRALVDDLAQVKQAGRDGVLAQLINQRLVGSRLLILNTATDAANGRFTGASAKEAVLARYPGWSNPALWQVIGTDTSRFTDHYLLASLDLQRADGGSIAPVPPDQAVFIAVLARTLWISIVVTALCAALSIPLAQAIASAPPAWSKVMFALVLFPLWTSLLVRTVIWIIVLQKNGPVNSSLLFLGAIDQPLSLIYTRFSLYLAMVQVLLPMMVLSVLSVMRRIPQSYMRAALSLGAPWTVAWRRVQLPLIMPGILAGSAIVFVFALGYYITPVLVGGPTDQMISAHVAFYINTTLNWGMAAALSVQLLMILALGGLLFWSGRALFTRGPTS